MTFFVIFSVQYWSSQSVQNLHTKAFLLNFEGNRPTPQDVYLRACARMQHELPDMPEGKFVTLYYHCEEVETP